MLLVDEGEACLTPWALTNGALEIRVGVLGLSAQAFWVCPDCLKHLGQRPDLRVGRCQLCLHLRVGGCHLCLHLIHGLKKKLRSVFGTDNQRCATTLKWWW